MSEDDKVQNIEDAPKKTAKAASKARKAASEKLEAAREKFGEVAAGVDRGVKAAKDGAGRVSEQVRDRAGRAGVAAREGYGTARDSVREGYDRVSKDVDQLTQNLNEYVRHNPGRSIAIAVGVGFFVGIMMRGRRD